MINPNLAIGSLELKEPYNSQLPFPHLVFDDFLDETILYDASLEAKFLSENMDTEGWRFDKKDHHHSQVAKRSLTVIDNMTPAIRLISQYVNNPQFLTFLREMTGMPGLVGDWTFNGGGLHVTPKDGFLNVHQDFNFLGPIESPELYRKVNLLIYLNEEWKDDYNGNLELWESDLSDKAHEIVPQYNRAVIFNIEDAPHGHPTPLTCPEGESRRSLAYYFYDTIPLTTDLKERAYWKKDDKLI
tara:strand:- start:39 stop:767 length:729 start_codon:yes stop_codon:yes gene_type:complete